MGNTRDTNGKFKVGNPGGGLKNSNNPDRRISILETVVTDTITVDHLPDGDGKKLDKPKKMLLYDWVKDAFKSLTILGGFRKPNGDLVEADQPKHKVHINHVLAVATELKELSITDMQYLAKYKRDGLLENPELTLVKKHFRDCKNICSVLDVYAPRFAMRGYQREAINRQDFIVILTGGRGRGGSHVMIPMMLLQTMAASVPVVVTIGRKDKAANRTSTFISALALLTVPEFAMMVDKINGSTMTITFINGAKCVFIGYHTEQQRAGSKGIGQADDLGGGVWKSAMEEATDGFTEDDFDTIQTNTRAAPKGMPPPQIIMPMNPSHPNHPIKKNIIDGELIETTPHGGRVVKFGTKTAVIYNKTAKDNEWLMENNPDYWDQLLAIKSPTLRARLAYGLWESAEGAVYTEFDLLNHVVSDPTFNILEKMKYKEGYIVVGGDWGARDATAIVWMYVEDVTITLPQADPNKEAKTIKTWSIFVYRQFYMYNCNREHVARFIASFPDSGMATRFIGGHEGVSEIDSLKRLGIKATQNKDKRAVGEYDKATMAEFTNEGMGEGRFRVLKNCLVDNSTVDQRLKLSDWQPPKPSQPVSIETELPMATWEMKTVDGNTQPTGKIKDGNDHIGDAMLNAMQFIQHRIDGNNIANLKKFIMGLNGRR